MAPELDQDAARTLLADLLSEDVDGRTDQIMQTVAAEVPSFAQGLSSITGLRARLHIVDARARALALESGHVDLGALEEFGTRNAEADVPLQDVQSVLWIAFDVDWEHVTRAARRRGLAAELQVELAGALWSYARGMNIAVVEAYRRVSTRRAVELNSRASVYITALLENNMPDPGMVLGAVSTLGLGGMPLVCVVVVRVTELGTSPLPGIRSALARHGMPSAWRLGIDTLVGIVGLADAEMLTRVFEEVAAGDPGEAGISPTATVTDIAASWHLAQLALSSATPRRPVRVFGDDVVDTTIAAASPVVMERLCDAVLGALDELPDATRRDLLSTFLTWIDAGGSVRDAARALFRHPNTVRYRLRKFERVTGRSLRDPKDVADLTLAVRWCERRGSTA